MISALAKRNLGGGPSPGYSPLDGTVIVRNEAGHVVARSRATSERGFRLRLAPGSYELRALVIIRENGREQEAKNCPAETAVKLHPGQNPAVRLFVNCETV